MGHCVCCVPFCPNTGKNRKFTFYAFPSAIKRPNQQKKRITADETQSSLDKILEQKYCDTRLDDMVSLYKNYTCVFQLLEQIRLHESRDYLEVLLLHATIENGDQKSLKQLLQSGIDVFSTFNNHNPLELAISKNNLDCLYVILYYGGHHLNPNQLALSPFAYSMQCRCSADIQKVLLDYEENLNEPFSRLIFAIMFKSPLISDIIEKGGDVNWFSDEKNAISLGLRKECPPDIFKVLWQKFDYNIWKQSFSKCVLVYFVFETTDCDVEWRRGILRVLLENEEKLKLDIEHHNNSYFWESDSLISEIVQTCWELDMNYDYTHACTLQLLSHGALIFKSDIDNIYFSSKYSQLANILLFMDFYHSEHSDVPYSWMYFKYTLQPDLYEFVSHCGLYLDKINPMIFIDELKHLYYFDEKIINLILDFETDEIIKAALIEGCQRFPSLLELSREAARNSLCNYYRIKNVSLFYTILKSLNVPSFVKEFLTLQRYAYKKY